MHMLFCWLLSLESIMTGQKHGFKVGHKKSQKSTVLFGTEVLTLSMQAFDTAQWPIAFISPKCKL